MKLSTVFILAIVTTFFIACSGNEKNAENARQQPVTTSPVTTPATTPAATTQPLNNTSTTSAGGVLHYLCTNNSCASKGTGGGTKINCPACGVEYTHNTAFHNQGTTTTPTAQPNPMFQSGQQPPTQTTTTAPAATNAAGVYHYICSKGCAGGGASAGNCSNCGGTLAHNQAFHN